MHAVEPKVFLIAHTVITPGLMDWLNHIGAGGSEFLARVASLGYVTNNTGQMLVEACGRRCYQAFTPGVNPNVTKVREDERAYHENILAQGHGSVLAHTVASFAIEGVSRVWTGEMNRHWAGLAVAEPDAISEGSMRYIRLTDMGAWNPWQAELESRDWGVSDYGRKLVESSAIFKASIMMDEGTQANYASIWADELAGTDFTVKKVLTSRFRRDAPMGVATGGVWTFNMRSLRHVLCLRTGLPGVEEEMHLVVRQLGDYAKAAWPLLFQDIEWQGDADGWVAKYGKV